MPPKKSLTDKKIANILLDLDNTCISAMGLDEFPFKEPGIKEKAMKFPLYDMDGYYIIFERPGLQDFLDFAFKNFNVAIWTAASKDYALFIVDKIMLKKPDRKLDYILFSYHCDISKKIFKPNEQKNLKLLNKVLKIDGYNVENSLLIDDLDENWDFQKNNCIKIKAFEVLDEGSEHDKELLKIQEILEQVIP
jgi:TFIIF-interacting CTD phosphatase-like protein